MAKIVIHDNDGHVDDLLSSLLLWLSPEIDLQAITITNGDCYVDQSFEAMVKIATFLELEGSEIAFSDDDVTNKFPENWRRETYITNQLPIFSGNALKKPYQQRARKSEALIVDCLNNSNQPVTFVTTGPLNNVAQVFRERPDLKAKVEEMVIMGGALKVPGNVQEEGADGSAEWNFYADPAGAKAILDSGIPLKLITLDLTNQLPVTADFLSKLEQQGVKSKASRLASNLWSLVKGIDYYFWDTVTVAAVIAPELFTFKTERVEISTQGPSQGKLSHCVFGGRKVKMCTSVHKEKFEELVLSILRTK